MPAKKRGKGSRKSKKASPKAAAAAKPPKTPAAKGSSTASGSKRKAKEALVVSVPRRVSPRLLAKRKMQQQENGFGSHEEALGMITLPVDNDEEVHDHRGISSNSNRLKPSSSTRITKDKAERSQDASEDAGGDGGVAPDEAVEANGGGGGEESGEEEEDMDQMLFERGTGPRKELAVGRIIVQEELKEAEETLSGHAVLLYFWRMEVTMTCDLAEEWIRNALGDAEAIGHVQHCRDLGRGFFLVVFELAIARRKALAFKPRPFGIQVSIFPWCPATVNDEGEQCAPRMIVLPGLPDQCLFVLPKIARSLGSFIGCVSGRPKKEAVRGEEGFAATPACAKGAARIAVMIPPELSIPATIEIQLRTGVCKKQPIYEEEEVGRGRKRVAAAAAPGRAAKKLKN